MTVLGVSVWRFVVGVIGAELAPVLVLVAAMFVVGTAAGARPSQETAERYGAWIGPIFGAIATGVIAYPLARHSPRPIPLGLVFGISVALLDVALIAAQRAPFQMLFVLSALARIAGGVLGGWVAGRGGPAG